MPLWPPEDEDEMAELTADPIAGDSAAITDWMRVSWPPLLWPWPLRLPWVKLWELPWLNTGLACTLWTACCCCRWGRAEARADCTALEMLGVIVDRIREMMSDSDRPEDLEGWATWTGAKLTCCSCTLCCPLDPARAWATALAMAGWREETTLPVREEVEGEKLFLVAEVGLKRGAWGAWENWEEENCWEGAENDDALPPVENPDEDPLAPLENPLPPPPEREATA